MNNIRVTFYKKVVLIENGINTSNEFYSVLGLSKGQSIESIKQTLACYFSVTINQITLTN
jgi:hypothetical protein